MRVWVVVTLVTIGFIGSLQGSANLERARQLESSGDALGARDLLARAAQDAPRDIMALTEYAEYLDRHGDAAAKDAYIKLLAALDQPEHNQRRAAAERRLAELALLGGDRAAALGYLEEYRKAGGSLAVPDWRAGTSDEARQYVEIPGPMRSFGRMAAISGETQPEDILPALARNVVTNGYQASHTNEALEPTEYLKLLHRYITQARELERLAGPAKTIRIEACEAPNVAELLKILGFRMRGGCGSEIVLETVNATRAFITTDSGFPLPDLEQALRTNRPFIYEDQPTRVPLLFDAAYWLSAKEKDTGDFIEVFLSDPALCRLYLGMSKLDRATAEELRKNIPMPRLKVYSHVLDFFGSMFEIRDGKAVVPGGPQAIAAWTDLAGVSPEQGGAFFEKLITRDDGWMASYFDALARLDGPVAEYLTDPVRMKRFYLAIRGKVTSPGPARPVFRSNTDMMLLTTRLWMEAGGRPHIPGNLQVWRNLMFEHQHGKSDAKAMRAAGNWKDADDAIEALFALTRRPVENEPLKVFLALSDLDRSRPQPLAAGTVERLAHDYPQYGQQYAIFNDAAILSDASIIGFLDTCIEINRLKDQEVRADTAGTLQALVGLWQIFSRQGSLPPAKADETFAGLVSPFAAVHDERTLFDAGRNGVKLLLAATGSAADARPQERLIGLLAGSADPRDVESQRQVVEDMLRILEAQKIVSLDDMLAMAENLDGAARGEKLNSALLNRLAARINVIAPPQPTLSGVEKNALASTFWIEKHLDAERKLNWRAAVEKSGGDKLRDLRGLLAPFLRDTLAAYNYAHYAPPGAQILYTNPLFVRSHDFLGLQGTNHLWRATQVYGAGWPSNGGGRLVGSLAGLPYALAEAEQNFLVPQQTQALIWTDLAPQMILSAVIPRWWNVTPAQMHWVALHLRYADSLLAGAALEPALRQQVLDTLRNQDPPARVRRLGLWLESGQVKSAADALAPAELFALAVRMGARQMAMPSPLLAEIQRLAASDPRDINYTAISNAFGTPKPTLANSYRPALLNLRMFPALMGYSSRILAESWESNALYWAELADETYITPSQLNLRVPEWTEKLIEHIFASHLEDWPAVLRSLHSVGDEVRAKSRPQLLAEEKAALP